MFLCSARKEHKTDEDSKDDVLRPIEPNFDEHKRPPKHEKGKQKIKRYYR